MAVAVRRDKNRDALALFADELKAHRVQRGWTQADIAAKTSYSESLIAQVETCRKSATPELGKALDRLFATPGFTESEGTSPVRRGRRADRGQAPEPAVSRVVPVLRAA